MSTVVRCPSMPSPRRKSALAAIALGLVLACGGPSKPPKRGVIEGSVSSWRFRRYQAVLDVEVWVPNNRAAAHTASYVKHSAEKRGAIGENDVVNVFVTRYKSDDGILRALVKFVRRLAQESAYVVEEKKLGGTRVLVVSGAGELWALWAARRHVIKVGGRGLRSIPESIVEAYDDRYPSTLKVGILDGPLPPGPDEEQPKEAPEEPFDPDHPRPDWNNKTKTKTKKK